MINEKYNEQCAYVKISSEVGNKSVYPIYHLVLGRRTGGVGIQEELREVYVLFDLSPLYRRIPWANLLLAETLVGLLYPLRNLTPASRGCSHCGNNGPVKVSSFSDDLFDNFDRLTRIGPDNLF